MKQFLIFKQCSPASNNESGMTILELLVASTLGLIVTGFSYMAIITHQRTVVNDVHRTRLSQNLRGVLDFLAVDSRQAGEQLPRIFPAVILESGVGDENDTLTFRRNVLSEEITVCSSLNSGASLNTISLDTTAVGAPPVCIYGSQEVAYDSWAEYLDTKNGSFEAYIFNTATKEGEFITISGSSKTNSNMTINGSGQNLAYSYPRYTSVVYVIEEWEYSLSDDNFLILTENQDFDNAKRIAFDITSFQVNIAFSDGTSSDSFDETNNWGSIAGIEINISGKTSSGKKIFTDSLSSKFFPRNILSL